MNTNLKRLTISAMMLALALLLPFVTGQIPSIGKMLLPMHVPVLLCGFICGAKWGFSVGLISPLLRSLIVGAPSIYPTAAAMAFELAVYGLAVGLLYKRLPKNIPNIYLSLTGAMIFGRVTWGIATFVFSMINDTAFPFSAFLLGAFTQAAPGILLQLIFIPILIVACKKANLIYNE
ncbi:MAG: ECF transporter S component [Clostridia bacterium]